MHANGAMTESEQALLGVLSGMIDDACDATPRQVTEAQLIDSGWPRLIQPFAQEALAEMLRRGRFSEEREEIAPGSGA
jgi:hypothetical protein